MGLSEENESNCLQDKQVSNLSPNGTVLAMDQDPTNPVTNTGQPVNAPMDISNPAHPVNHPMDPLNPMGKYPSRPTTGYAPNNPRSGYLGPNAITGDITPEAREWTLAPWGPYCTRFRVDSSTVVAATLSPEQLQSLNHLPDKELKMMLENEVYNANKEARLVAKAMKAMTESDLKPSHFKAVSDAHYRYICNEYNYAWGKAHADYRGMLNYPRFPIPKQLFPYHPYYK